MAARSQSTVVLGDKQLALACAVRGNIKLSETRQYNRQDPVATAGLVRQLVDEHQHDGRPVMLALGSSWCTTATITIPSPRQARKRSAIGFLVEPHLPWSVEDAVLDY